MNYFLSIAERLEGKLQDGDKNLSKALPFGLTLQQYVNVKV